jgi:hypothetical protein
MKIMKRFSKWIEDGKFRITSESIDTQPKIEVE